MYIIILVPLIYLSGMCSKEVLTNHVNGDQMPFLTYTYDCKFRLTVLN